MKLLITGTPGSGKTTLAKMLGKKLKLPVINEKDFALQNSIGKFNEENELEIPTAKLEKKINSYLSKSKGVIFEGHVLCETKIKVDKVLLVKVDPEELEARLEQRNYSMQKIMDNVFCEGIEYCAKQVRKRYSKGKIIVVDSKGSSGLTFRHALSLLKK
jgi:adenylate kinase